MFDYVKTIADLSKDHTLKVNGAFLVMLAKVLASHAALVEEAMARGVKERLGAEDLRRLNELDETIAACGETVLEMISKAFGPKFYEQFVTGEIKITAEGLDMPFPKTGKMN